MAETDLPYTNTGGQLLPGLELCGQNRYEARSRGLKLNCLSIVLHEVVHVHKCQRRQMNGNFRTYTCIIKYSHLPC